VTDGVFFLAAVAAVQGIFLVLLMITLGINRARRQRQRVVTTEAFHTISDALTRWLVEDHGPHEVVRALRGVPPEIGLEQVSLSMAARVSSERQVELVRVLRREPWVRSYLAASTSWRWTVRLRSARMLVAVGLPEDETRLLALLRDPHPAVQIAATAAIPRVATPLVVSTVLDQLPERPSVVQQMQMGALKSTRAVLIPNLRARLARDGASVAQLKVWIRLAAETGDPELLGIAAALYAHPSLEIRVAVARLMQSYFHPDAVPRLRHLLADESAAVRAAAAKSLGAIGATEAVDALQVAMADRSWWVRFRSALSLASLGEPGRQSLRQLRSGSDRYAKEMSTMVSGLSEGALAELSD
jgi:HEAT repeat protein